MSGDTGGKRVGVRDVAVAAGVSAQTVSRVLNGYPGIREATRERVLDAVAALDYRVNNAARALGTWGLLACFDAVAGENVVALDPKKDKVKAKYGERVGFVGPSVVQGGLMKLPFMSWPDDLKDDAGENGYHSHMIAIEAAHADLRQRTPAMLDWARSARAFTFPGEVDEQTIIVLGRRRELKLAEKVADPVPAAGPSNTPAVPACTMRATLSGSQIGPATASARPWRMASAITLITSCVPPDAVLSPWSARMIGPPSSVRARAIWAASASPL